MGSSPTAPILIDGYHMNKIISKTCRGCDKTYDIEVEQEDFLKWQNGAFIQDAFPYLSVDDREMLISSFCGTCFNDMFPDMEEE